ncbi:spore germination protein [Bacillus sp. FJAT-49736]|uniref:spore germination protein n=1 Tax=Bacillus sp. FJAT-49736 TaxID=2833582 RepID=UPI001BC8E4FC|nr:spore germination protein [Bacillus sp. FJAT-49736]
MFFTPFALNLLGFKINSIDNASVVNVGPVQYIDQFTSYKRNQGFGELNGDLSPITIPIDYLLDPDISDSASIKNSIV